MSFARIFPIKYRLAGFVALALAIIFFIGAYSVLKLDVLSSNGIKMKGASEKVLHALTTVREVGELRRLTSEFLITGDKAVLNRIDEAAGKLSHLLPGDMKPHLLAYLKDIKTLSIRMDSYHNNKIQGTSKNYQLKFLT